MLAKQAWRILQNPGSLVAEVLKAGNFPRKDFMDAMLGSNPFYVSSSIYEGSELLRLGVRWKVENGEKRIHGFLNPRNFGLLPIIYFYLMI